MDPYNQTLNLFVDNRRMNMSGPALRDRGMQRAVDNAEQVSPRWTIETIGALKLFCEDMKAEGTRTFVMENFRATQYKRKPASPNVWGSISLIAARLGIIRWTGEYRNAKSPKTHAHPVKVWEIV